MVGIIVYSVHSLTESYCGKQEFGSLSTILFSSKQQPTVIFLRQTQISPSWWIPNLDILVFNRRVIWPQFGYSIPSFLTLADFLLPVLPERHNKISVLKEIGNEEPDTPHGRLKSSWSHVMFLCMLSRVWLLATPWIVAHQVSPSMEFSRQKYWSE